MFDHATGCLLRHPARTPTSGVSGQYCPRFVWRDDDTATTLDADSVGDLEGTAGPEPA
jgi:hypothetical protein